MTFFEAGDGFVTAPKIPVKISLRWLAKAKIFFYSIFLLQWCEKHTLIKKIFEIYALTLFRMGEGRWVGWGGKKAPPYQFFPCNFYKCRNMLPKLSDFQFQPFWHTGVKFQVCTQYQSQIIELQPRPALKKSGFSDQILINLRLL